MPEVLEKYGLTPDSLVKHLLKPLCYAKETKFFPYRVEEIVKPAHTLPPTVITHDEKGRKLPEPIIIPGVFVPAVTRTVQKIDEREVVAWSPRRDGLDMAFRLGGSYPQPSAPDPMTQIGVKVVLVGVPRPGQPLPPLVEVKTSGHKPENGDGQ